MTAPADKALVYLYRSGGIFRPFFEAKYKFYINDTCVAGALWPDGFYVWLLSPGKYTFQSQGSKLVLTALEGETYYIRQTGDYFKMHQKLEFVDKQLGHMRVAEAPLLKCRSIQECGRANKSEEVAGDERLIAAQMDYACLEP